jgi:hypothetical protein
VLLGTDAHETPAMPSDGLANAAFRSLLDATADAALLAPVRAENSVAG